MARLARTRLVKLGLTGAVVVSLAVSAFAFLLLPRLHASANAGLVTRGDAEALFNAGLTGCAAIDVHGSLHEGQPCEDGQRAQLRLFAPIPTQHYCLDDWHIVRITAVDTREALDQFSATFVLDGQPLVTRRTPVKPVDPTFAAAVGDLAPADDWVNIGTIVPPGALGVGTHTSHVETFFPAGVFDKIFVIDASGTGACLLP